MKSLRPNYDLEVLNNSNMNSSNLKNNLNCLYNNFN